MESNSPAGFSGGGIQEAMDIRKKNLLTAAIIAAIALGMYVYSMYHAFSSISHP
jgi:hypothetical protein